MSEMVHHGGSGHSKGLEYQCKICAPKIIRTLESKISMLTNQWEIERNSFWRQLNERDNKLKALRQQYKSLKEASL